MPDQGDKVWRVQIPSTADAQRYIEQQYTQGSISKRTRDDALRQVRNVGGVEYKSEAAAKRAAKSIKGARVESGYSEEKHCGLMMLMMPIWLPYYIGLALGKALGNKLRRKP